MSLDIEELGIKDVVLDIVKDVNSGYLHLFLVNSDANPYEPDDNHPTHLLSMPGFGYKQLKESEARDKFGSSQEEFCLIIIGFPPVEAPLNAIAFINFSDETKVISGRLRRLDKHLSSLCYCYVEREVALPLTWEEAKVLLPPDA